MQVCGLCCGFVIFLSTLTNLPWVCDDVGLCFVVVVDAWVCGGSLIASGGGGGGHSVAGGSGGSLGWV